MPRNFDRRVEAVAPVENPALHERIRSLLATYLEDNRQAWDLDADGRWHQREPDGAVRASHERLVQNSWGRVPPAATPAREALLDLGRVDVVGGEHPAVRRDDLDRHPGKVRQ
jgi:polyphosphate kinase